MYTKSSHTPVLLHEVIDLLAPKAGDIVVDGTAGAGGHAKHLCERIGPTGTLVCLDQDSDALALAEKRLSTCAASRTFTHSNFRHISSVLDALSIPKVKNILLDIGISGMHLTDSGRGFSFQRDEPLLMTMESPLPEGALTAADIVNRWNEKDIADVIYQYGEERMSRKIAHAIVDARKKKKILTTKELADIISSVIRKRGKAHPATRTFQALRIAVNDELGALKEGIAGSIEKLAPGGRLAIITFHSLEDRIVKQMFKEVATEGRASIVTKKPIAPMRDEIKENPRSRSAKLRVIEKI